MKPIKRNRRREKDYRMRVAKRRQRQGYNVYDPETKHWSTVDPKTHKFLKRSSHPTLQLEIDWYNSPEGAEFKKEYELVTHRRKGKGKERNYYKYKKRK